MSMRYGVMVLVMALVLGLVAGCSSGPAPSKAPEDKAAQAKQPEVQGPTIERIKARGKLIAGTKYDVPKFGYKDPETNTVDGFEIDLVRHIAKEILGDENAFETRKVTPQDRIELLNNGEIDIVIATFTVTEERKQKVDFSPVYYTDGIGLLVKKDSGIQTLSDLSGKKVGVSAKASTGPRLSEKASAMGVDIELVQFDGYPEIKQALLDGKVDAMSTDGAILAGYVDAQTVLLSERYTEEPYGIATKKGNEDLRRLVEQVVRDLKASGTLLQLQDKWGIRVDS